MSGITGTGARSDIGESRAIAAAGGRVSVAQSVPRLLAALLALRLGVGALVVLNRTTTAVLRALIWATLFVALRPFLFVFLAHTRAPGDGVGAEAK